MERLTELLPGTFLVGLRHFKDARGTFVKTFSESIYSDLGLTMAFKEEFYSSSAKNVIRGMHFQLPPFDHSKLVYCPVGSVLDVMLDLRKGKNYGQSASVILDSRQPQALLIPKGVAHGFKALEDDSLMVYKTSTEHAPAHDFGIRWDSFGFDWGSEKHALISERDKNHKPFDQFTTVF